MNSLLQKSELCQRAESGTKYTGSQLKRDIKGNLSFSFFLSLHYLVAVISPKPSKGPMKRLKTVPCAQTLWNDDQLYDIPISKGKTNFIFNNIKNTTKNHNHQN